MNGAFFVLGINVVVAGLLAASFYAIARLDRTNRSAYIFAIGFAVGALTQIFEFFVASDVLVQFSQLSIALGFLGAQMTIIYAITVRLDIWHSNRLAQALFMVSALVYIAILDAPRQDFIRQVLYQLPYAASSAYAVHLLVKARDKSGADWLLTGLFTLAFAQFLAKPFIALWTDGIGGQPTDYVSTLYAMISQSMGTTLVLAIGLLSLLLAARESASSLMGHSEVDAQTGLLNPSAFESRAEKWLEQVTAQQSASLTMIRIDCPPLIKLPPDFIAAIGTAIAEQSSGILIAGRTGPLSFAILERNANLFAARRRAERLRKTLAVRTRSVCSAGGIRIGITEHEPADSFMDMVIRGQWALAEAQRAGGNCVRLAARSGFSHTIPDLA